MNMQDPLDGVGDVLSQSEVERLLSQVQAEETTTTVVKQDGGKSRFKLDDIHPCDFRQPAFLTASELRKIRLRHEDFIRSLAARLSIYLRLEVSIQMAKLQTVLYQKFTESLSNPSHITLFKAEPLKGICLLDIPPRLGLTFVDRQLGGPAHSVNANRDLSEIETALLDQVSMIILAEWCNIWAKTRELNPVLLGHENNARFLQSSNQDAIMLNLSMEVRLGDCMEQIQLAFPYYTIEPLVQQLSTNMEDDHGPTQQAPKVRWNKELSDVKIRVIAEWHNLEMTARELANLTSGTILTLDPQQMNKVQIRLENMPKFEGRLGTSGGKWAVELTKVQTS